MTQFDCRHKPEGNLFNGEHLNRDLWDFYKGRSLSPWGTVFMPSASTRREEMCFLGEFYV